MTEAHLHHPEADRHLWSLEGNTCPVPGCVGFYRKYTNFNKHWVKVHVHVENYLNVYNVMLSYQGGMKQGVIHLGLVLDIYQKSGV